MEDFEQTFEAVRYAVDGAVATITLNRPDVANAQNSRMIDELDAAFDRADADDGVRVVILAAAGKHFSSGHDLKALVAGDDADPWVARRETPEGKFEHERTMYFERCLRIHDFRKPTIAAVQGSCVAAGLMLAAMCDLIVAADDAFFADPVVRMGIPGVEYFAHPWVLGPRFAKEVLFTGERFGALRAYQLGMVNRVVPRAELAEATFALADVIATMPPFGLALAKRAVNQCEDLMGMRPGMDSVFGLHHLAHAHNAEVSGDSLAGLDARGMKDSAAKNSGANG